MRILTLAEEREVKKQLERIKFIDGCCKKSGLDLRIAIVTMPDNAELWINILETALQANEANQRNYILTQNILLLL